MHRLIKLFGIIVLTTVIVFSFAGCDNFMQGEPSVRISITSGGGAVMGATFRAQVDGRGWSGDHGFEWFSSSSPTGWGSRIGVGPEITINSPSVRVGDYIHARRFNNGSDEWVVSNRIGPILP